MTVHLFSREPWPHQTAGVEQTIAALSNGTRSLCLTAPTGSGKTAMEIALAKWQAEDLGGKVLCLTNRILLTDQTRRVFQQDKVSVGVISASMKHLESDEAQVQIATIQTLLARRRSSPTYWVDADLLLVDEVHQQSTGESAELINEYKTRGARIVGVTATPLGVSNVCDELIVAARTRDLQDAGILCFAQWFAPSELDTRQLVKGKVDISITENDARKTWGPLRGDDAIRTRIVGNIIQHYQRLHPAGTHTLAFAPGVKESLWAAQFCRGRGIRALHVDGQDFWVDGEMHDRKRDERLFQESMEAWREGHVPIIWNRFCLDSETEILTAEGWVANDEMTLGHHVANWDDGRIFFAQPREIIRRQRTPHEAMVSLETPRRSIRVTENHDILYRTMENGRFKKDEARALVGRALKLPVSGYAKPMAVSIAQPNMLANLRRRITSNAYAMRKRGYDPETSHDEATRRLMERASLRYKTPQQLTIDECLFIGFWLGDGSKQNLQRGGIEYRVWQGMDCPRIIRWFDDLCDSIGLDRIKKSIYTENETEVIQWSLPRGTGFGTQKRKGLFHLEPYLEKSGTDLFWGLDDNQFDAVIRGLWIADATLHGDNTTPGVRLSMCLANRKLFDLLQAIAVCRGYRASIREYPNGKGHTIYHLTLTKTDEHAMTKYRLQIEKAWRPEEVWCVRTTSGNIITRRHGSVTVMGNCLREGIDEPQIQCIILATPIGSYRSFVQMVGRGLRTHESKERCCVIDHAGAWWRFGSVNVNVDWESVFDCEDPDVLTKNRIAKERETGLPMGQVCPKCGMVHKAYSRLTVCQYCGHRLHLGKPSRPILQADGTLTEISGEPIKQWKIKRTPEAQQIWEGQYWHAMKHQGGEVTFNELYARAGYRTAVLAGTRERPAFWHAYYPPRDLPLMPRNANAWHRCIKDVPREDLY